MLSFFIPALNNLAIRIKKISCFCTFSVSMGRFERCVIVVDSGGCSYHTQLLVCVPRGSPCGSVPGVHLQPSHASPLGLWCCPLPAGEVHSRGPSQIAVDLFQLTLISSKKAHSNTLDGISGT